MTAVAILIFILQKPFGPVSSGCEPRVGNRSTRVVREISALDGLGVPGRGPEGARERHDGEMTAWGKQSSLCLIRLLQMPGCTVLLQLFIFHMTMKNGRPGWVGREASSRPFDQSFLHDVEVAFTQ